MFVETKDRSPLASNLSKTATSFLDLQAKLEKLIFIVIKINIENFVNAI